MRLLFAVALIFATTVSAAERRDDYAFAAPLKLDPGAALYEAPLTLDVYRRTVFADLRDVRVFNGEGEVVPYSLRQPAAENAERRTMRPVPLFPLRGDATSVLDALRIVVAGRGANVQFETPSKKTSVAPLVGYLVDLRGQQESSIAMELSWPESTPQFATSVIVLASDDLSSWRTVVSEAPIANLEFAGQKLREQRVDFSGQGISGVRAKYLRISWPSLAAAFELQSVSVEPVATRVETLRLQAEGVGVESKEGGFEFDLRLQAPIDRIKVVLPQINTLVSAIVWSRPSPASPWVHVAQSTLYRLRHDDRELGNPALSIAPNSDRYWRISGEQQQFGAGAPQLNVAWIPARVVFLARGSPPFELAAGNNLAQSAVSPLTAIAGEENAVNANRVAPARATLGDFVDAGGSRKLAQRAAVNWRNWALWGVLMGGVALLAWMARRLSREMSRK
jgi:hypothetical protein